MRISKSNNLLDVQENTGKQNSVTNKFVFIYSYSGHHLAQNMIHCEWEGVVVCRFILHNKEIGKIGLPDKLTP